MEKVDIAIQSFNKPESLFYTLLTLHKYSQDRIGTVYINDDSTKEDVISYYYKPEFKNALSPWNIEVRRNTYRMGWWLTFVRKYWPAYLTLPFFLKRVALNVIRTGRVFCDSQNIRYQWAIDSTRKKYLFVIHDDVEFRADIISEYLEYIQKKKKPAVVGDLGQCWRCPLHDKGCSPSLIESGNTVSDDWPNTALKPGDHQWACRINEWCALLSVPAVREIQESERLFYGNYDNNGDVSAYWFARAVQLGYSIGDPLPLEEQRTKYYEHGWQGFSGHSVWTDQGDGKSSYSGTTIERLIDDTFGVKI